MAQLDFSWMKAFDEHNSDILGEFKAEIVPLLSMLKKYHTARLGDHSFIKVLM